MIAARFCCRYAGVREQEITGDCTVNGYFERSSLRQLEMRVQPMSILGLGLIPPRGL